MQSNIWEETRRLSEDLYPKKMKQSKGEEQEGVDGNRRRKEEKLKYLR